MKITHPYFSERLSMIMFAKVSISLVGILIMLAAVTFGQEKDRAKISDKYKWNLTDLYPTDEAWRAAKEQLVAELPSVAAYPGTLKNSPKQLLNCLGLVTNLTKVYARLQTYASLISDRKSVV